MPRRQHHGDYHLDSFMHREHILEFVGEKLLTQGGSLTAYALDIRRRQAGLTKPVAGTWTTIRTSCLGEFDLAKSGKINLASDVAAIQVEME